MVQCERCGHDFKWQYMLDKHLARKFPCKAVKTENPQRLEENTQRVEEIPQSMEENTQSVCEFCLKPFSRLDKHVCKLKGDHVRKLEIQLGIKIDSIPKDHCRFCSTTFSRKDSMCRHILTCKAKTEYEKQLEKQLEEKHMTAGAKIVNNIQTQNNTQNITNNFILRPFGKENMDYITREVILKLCRKANLRDEIIPRLVRTLHCNPKHPENHNLMITNLRAPYGKIYDGQQFIVDPARDIIDKVMDNVAGLLTDECAFGDDDKFKPYERAIERIESDMGDVDSKFKAEQRVKVKSSLYNNKKLLEKAGEKVAALEN